MKSVHFRSYSGPHFPAFGLNTEGDGVSLRIQSECGKICTRVTPNTDSFYSVNINDNHVWKSERSRMISKFSIGEIYEFKKFYEK